MFLIDPITKYLWLETRIGQILSNQPWSTLAWGILLAALMFVSVYFDALIYRDKELLF
jgi:hypothetical protein